MCWSNQCGWRTKVKTFGTRLSRCELAIEHAEYLVRFERKNVPTVSPSPSDILDEFRSLRTQLIISEAESVVERAFEKSSLASTANAKKRVLAAGVLKLREVTQGLRKHSLVKPMEEKLRQEIHRVTLDAHLRAARKAEFKGNIKKAIDQYQEALYFIRNDDIDDAEQQSSIREIEAKLEELSAKRLRGYHRLDDRAPAQANCQVDTVSEQIERSLGRFHAVLITGL